MRPHQIHLLPALLLCVLGFVHWTSEIAVGQHAADQAARIVRPSAIRIGGEIHASDKSAIRSAARVATSVAALFSKRIDDSVPFSPQNDRLSVKVAEEKPWLSLAAHTSDDQSSPNEPASDVARAKQPAWVPTPYPISLAIAEEPISPNQPTTLRGLIQSAPDSVPPLQSHTGDGLAQSPLLMAPAQSVETYAVPLEKAADPVNASINGEKGLVTLVATEAELREVLRMIADHHGLNLVLGPEVSGPVTVSIRGARLEEVLDAILGVAGFNWHQVDNLLYVTGQNSTGIAPNVQGRRLQVYPLDYLASADLEGVISGLLSPVGTVFINESQNDDQLKTRELIIVEDVDKGHERIAQYLAQVDVPPKQVLVEAHVLQIDLGEDERHGINLNLVARMAGARVTLAGNGFAPDSPEGPSVSMRVDGTDMASFIECLRSNTTSRTLASPKVSVVNHQEAKIQIGERLPYAVATTTQTATIQNVQFLDVGIVLTVTPVITDDGNILMTVLPKVSGGRITENGFPEEDTTEVSTTVLMPDGGGLVIGGLIRENQSSDIAQQAFLGRVPVVGRLFRRTAETSSRDELVIALVTHIMQQPCGPRMIENHQLQDALPPQVMNELIHQ